MKILSFMRDKPMGVSGEELGSLLGLSRVAVWKHVAALRKTGFSIVSDSKGYRLGADYIDPLSINKCGLNLYYFYSIATTMQDVSQEEAGDQACIVVAEKQLSGRGRKQRNWLSEEGGLYTTFILHPKVSFSLLFRYLIASCIAVVDVLRSYGINSKIKWPNDIYYNDKKIAGTLLESQGEYDQIVQLKLGIGLNINNEILPDSGIAMASILGEKVDRTAVLNRLIEQVIKQTAVVGDGLLLDRWRERSSTPGKRVALMQDGSSVEGRALDIDYNGNLLVDVQGREHLVYYGDSVVVEV